MDKDNLDNDLPHVAFIGRSNAGKSSLINSLTGVKNLARVSSNPGRTQGANIFLINKAMYFIDLPGYGFAKKSVESLQSFCDIIHWYLFDSDHKPRVVLIVDAEVGPTSSDLEMFEELQANGREIIVVANKVDKIKKSQLANQLKKIAGIFEGYQVVPYSSDAGVGTRELTEAIFGERKVN